MGLEAAGLKVVWSNDVSKRKHEMFEAHFSSGGAGHHFELGDLRDVESKAMPSDLAVAWASFPCTDLSLAGTRGGLHAGASSAFWLFIRNLASLRERKPHLVALENVTGFVSSRAGRDLAGAIRALNGLGYSVDVVSLDARRFVPQSRPRLFLIGIQGEQEDDERPSILRPRWLDGLFEDASIRTHRARLPEPPEPVSGGLTEALEVLSADDPRWWDAAATESCLRSLTDLQRARADAIRNSPAVMARSAFRRMRDGVPRWELRSDDIAGCLRTARGGSSRQAVAIGGAGEFRLRWMTPLEYARLMGAGGFDVGKATTYQAYSGFGDAVCVPVVEWLARNYILKHLGPEKPEVRETAVISSLVPA
jgi:DNA (cytosine-5)-methyltransferase 1